MVYCVVFMHNECLTFVHVTREEGASNIVHNFVAS